MRLECRRALSVLDAYSACPGPESNQWIVGKKDGNIYFYGSDGSLEKVARVGTKPVLVTRVYDEANVCYISGRSCGVYNFHKRKVVLSFNTTSASMALAEPRRGVLVVASKRKVRWTDDMRQVHTIDIGERLSAMVFQDSYEMICMCYGSLMKLDLLTGEQSTAGLPRLPGFWRAHQYSAIIVNNLLVVGVGPAVYTVNEDNTVLADVSWKNSQQPKALLSLPPFYIAVFSDHCDLVNPDVGKVYSSVTVKGAELRLPSPGSVVVDATGILEFKFDVAIHDFEKMGSLGEAACLAARLPALKSETFELQERYATELFEKGEYNQALSIFDSLKSYEQVATLIVPLLEHAGHEYDEPIKLVSSYLASARRKLRIKDHTFSETVDNALFRCYVHMHSPLVGSLLRSQNRCSEFVVCQLLPKESHWKDLADFFKSRGQHDAALQLVADHSDNELAAYLETLVAPEPDLVFKYGRGLVQKYGEKYARPLFWDEAWCSSIRIFSYLNDISSKLALSYMKYRIANGDNSPELHEVNAQQLDGPDLLAFLRSSTAYRPEVLLESMQKGDKDAVLPAKAILFSRLGHHAEAIDAYLEAEEYGAAIEYAAHHGGVQHLFDRLLTQPGRHSDMINLLNLCGPPTALAQLPDSFTASELGPYLIQRARESASELQESKIVAALRHLDLGNTSLDLADKEKQFVIIEPTSKCAICHKRLGLSVLGIRENKAVHFGCL